MNAIKEICDYIHNYFTKKVYSGSFVIAGGTLDTAGMDLSENQYFMIGGSIFNDGIYQYGVDELTDEEFTGFVTTMAIPQDVQDIAKEIATWTESNTATLNSPYTSESFGGYSYSKSNGAGGQVSWRDIFGKRLNAYRKLG